MLQQMALLLHTDIVIVLLLSTRLVVEAAVYIINDMCHMCMGYHEIGSWCDINQIVQNMYQLVLCCSSMVNHLEDFPIQVNSRG